MYILINYFFKKKQYFSCILSKFQSSSKIFNTSTHTLTWTTPLIFLFFIRAKNFGKNLIKCIFLWLIIFIFRHFFINQQFIEIYSSFNLFPSFSTCLPMHWLEPLIFVCKKLKKKLSNVQFCCFLWKTSSWFVFYKSFNLFQKCPTRLPKHSFEPLIFCVQKISNKASRCTFL